MSKDIIFSGVQPTGDLHIGNYLGAIKNWVKLQNSGKYDCFFCIVDYHSLTGNMDAKGRQKQILKTAAELLALGIDPKKSTFFIQSEVAEHTELAWIFNTVTPMNELVRMTQFKDKSGNQEKNINVGLFDYPVLQAADILLYKGTHVPVGRDQVQHIELTRDIARWFNNRYGSFFKETKAKLTECPKVMSLLEPTKKMSKSYGDAHVINLADSPEVIESKVKKAVTDSGKGKSPGAENLMLLLKNFADKKTYKQFMDAGKAGAVRYGDLKKAVSDSISMHFGEFREKREELLVDKDKIREIMDMGAKKASIVASETMEKVRKMVGVRK
ncbi:MAG: tryptophan--tRNA ligase [bacterium]|nr:tryptophan--tRNA ligase [bacterium]